MRLNNPIIKCPLPHLGYGIDADGNGVELTPNNVGVEYSDNGSDYLLENGAVDKFSNDFYNRNLAAPLKKENYEKENYITWNENDNSIITGTNTYSSLFVYQLNKEKVLKGFKYTFSASTDSDAKILFRFIDSNMEIITEYTKYFSYNIYYMGHIRGYNSPVTFIVPLNCAYIQFGIASAATNLFLKDPVLKLSSDNQNIYIPNNTSKTPLYSIESGDTLINGSNFLNNTPFKIDMLNINTDLEYAFFNKSDETIWDDFVRASDNFDTENPYLWDMEEINQQFIYDHCLIEYQYWIKNINNIIKDIILYDKPLPLLRSLNERNDSTITDSIAGRNANIKGLASSFNGVDGQVDFPDFNFIVGKFIEFYIDLSKMDSIQYIFGNSVGDGVRWSSYDNNFIITSSVKNGVLSFSETKGRIEKLRIERISNTTFSFYNEDGFIGDITADFSDDIIFNRIGNRGRKYYLNTSIHSINFNNELFIPLPHTGIGFDSNGDTVELTVSGGVTQEIVDGGSLWMQEHGAVFSNKEVNNYTPNNESNELAYPLEEGQTAIPAAPNSLNTTPFGITLFTTGQTDSEYTFFDKSDKTIWDDFVRASDNYDSDNTGVWYSTELNQEFINEHCLLSSKYEIDIINNVIKNITLKDSSSVVVSNLKKYVRLG